MKLFQTTNKVSLDLSLAKERIQMQFRDKAVVSASLQQMLLDSQEQGRLICGIYDSGTLLSKNPDNVMLCILPKDASDDVALHIHFTLIEAFCWENDIPVIKVDSADKLKQLLLEDDDGTDGSTHLCAVDFNCLLVEFPIEDECSVAEENVLEFYKISCDVVPQLVLELEV